MKAAKTMIESAKDPGLLPEPNRAPRWVLPSVKWVMIFVDSALAVFCFCAAFYIREGRPFFAGGTWEFSREFAPYAGIAILAVPIRLATLFYQRVYRLQGAFSYLAELIKIFKAVSVGSLVIVAIAFMFRGGFAYREFSYSRAVFLIDFALALALFSAFHLLIRYVQTLVRKRDINLIPTLIVGQNAEAMRTIRELEAQPDIGYRVVGIVGTDTLSSEETFEGKKVVGGFDDLPDLIRKLMIQEVIITEDKIPNEKLFEAMMQLGRKQKVEFRLAPSLFNFVPQKTSVEQIGVLPMVRLFREPLTDAERFIKRISDIVISLAALAFVLPLWLLVTILIKLDSKGPSLFRQERVGMDGRIFLCYKFRSMRADADESLHREAYQKNIEGHVSANAGDDEKPVFGKVKDDPRVTKIGKLLRRSSLDELPQLLNVLIGDMSIVGPRPPIPYEVEKYDLQHRRRLEMKPGITGLWQVSGRNRLTFEEMVDIDLYYIENWSLWLDIKILLMTLPAVFRGDGAR